MNIIPHFSAARPDGEPDGRDEKKQIAEDGGERAGGMLPLLPVSNSICQWPIGNWQHLHIGNILKTPRQPMRQTVGRAPRARRNEPPPQQQRRIIADGSESRPYHANLPRWYFHFVLDLSLMRLIAASAAGARRLSHFKNVTAAECRKNRREARESRWRRCR